MAVRADVQRSPLGNIDGTKILAPEIVKVHQLVIAGCPICSVEPITVLHRDTILKLPFTDGENCQKLMGRLIVNVHDTDVGWNETRGFVGKKQ